MCTNNKMFILTVIFVCILYGSAVSEKTETGQHVIGIYAGLDENTLKQAHAAGVDIIFPSITWYEPQPWAAGAVARAHEYGFKVYPSVAAAYDGYGDKQSEFARQHPQFWEKRKDGSLLDSGTQVNLSWGYPQVREYKVNTIAKFIIEGGFDGILLDYTRFFGNDTGYSDIIVSEFKQAYGRDPFMLPTDDPDWVLFRANYVTDFVRHLRNVLLEKNPTLKIIGCVDPDPRKTLRNSLLDWQRWIDEGLIDGVVTMIYERNTNNTLKNVMIANRAVAGKGFHIPMVAPWNRNLDTPELLKEASMKCLKLGCAGVAYYRIDAINELDLWPAISEIAHWTQPCIDATPVNYVLNGSFENDLEYYAIGHGDALSVSTKKARTGKKSLRVDGGTIQSLSQLLDRGFLPDKQSFRMEGWVWTEDTDRDSKLLLEFDISYREGSELAYRIPVRIPRGEGWRKFSTEVPLDSNKLNFVIFRIQAEENTSPLYLDDLQWVFSDRPAAGTDGAARIDRSIPLRNLKGKNLARGQLVTASSFLDNDWPPANAVNGLHSSDEYARQSAWHSQRPASNQWLKIYLPRTYRINRIRLLNSSAPYPYRTKDFRIEISTDDLDYSVAAKGQLPNNGQEWIELDIKETAAKYIKFVGITGYHPDYAIGLQEIEVY